MQAQRNVSGPIRQQEQQVSWHIIACRKCVTKGVLPWWCSSPHKPYILIWEQLPVRIWIAQPSKCWQEQLTFWCLCFCDTEEEREEVLLFFFVWSLAPRWGLVNKYLFISHCFYYSIPNLFEDNLPFSNLHFMFYSCINGLFKISFV